jgi:DNA invertase Pin-like site-specific DNA recombinase
MFRVALYCRVSTNNGQQSPEMQLRELREYCSRREWQIATEYIDAGISGAKEKAPELDRLMVDAAPTPWGNSRCKPPVFKSPRRVQR